MSLFVLASKDGWVNIMYHGLDAVGIDQQVTEQTQTRGYTKRWCRLMFSIQSHADSLKIVQLNYHVVIRFLPLLWFWLVAAK